MNTLDDILILFWNLIDGLVVIVVALGLVFFLWGLAKFILNAGDEKGREAGKQVMFWGIIALFVMISVWGIINFLQSAIFGNGGIEDPWDIPSI